MMLRQCWLNRVVLCAATLLLCAAACAAAQSGGVNYTDDMPSVQRVQAEIGGSDATDALARQEAVFNYLTQYIQRIKYNRTVRGPYTPGENKLLTDYSAAAYKISQDYAKTHTAAEAKAFEQLHGRYEMDSAFYADWSKRLIGKQSAAAYKGAATGLAATAKAHYDAEKKQNEAAAQGGQSGGGLLNDPGAKTVRRCLELGGTDMDCLGKGFSAGLMDLLGVGDTPLVKAMDAPMHTGLRMGGSYATGHGVGLAFRGDSVIVGCGKLVPDGRDYAVTRRSGGGLEITIANDPARLHMVWNADGTLSGPGPADVTGREITGYQTYNVQQRYTSDNTMVPGSAHQEQVPIYAQRTEQCMVGGMQPTAATDPEESITSMLSAMFGGQESQEKQQNDQQPMPAGPSIEGVYAGAGGLRMEFHPAGVILDCGEAHVLRTYRVRVSGGALAIAVANGATPFMLELRGDGTLAGAGSTTVAGRLITGKNANGIVYQPKVQSCAVGVLTAQQ